MAKNIIFFHTDQQRWDSLGCYGNSAAKTENLDKLAAEGVRFEHHYCTNPVCMPSRTSLFTGRHLPAHGVIDNGIPMDEREVTITRVLANAGYDTYAAGKLHFTPYQLQTEKWYGESYDLWKTGRLDSWDGPYYDFKKVDLVLGHGENALRPERGHYGKWIAENWPQLSNVASRGFEEAAEPKWPWVYRSEVPVEAHYSSYVAERVIDHLKKRKTDQPFFIFAGFSDPHEPYITPTEYAAKFDGVELPEPHYRKGENDNKPSHYERALHEDLFPLDGGARRIPEAGKKHHIAQNTYAMVTLIDDCIGRVLKTVKELGLEDDTVICFTSDHGELLGDHDLFFKGPMPYASLMRVPFIIKSAGVKPAVSQAPMSNIDVMPSLLELVGVPIPETVQGESFAAVLAGEKERVREAAFSCGWYKGAPAYRHMSLHSDKWRITYWPGQQKGELYDLDKDPYEYENMFDDSRHCSLRDRLLAKLFRTYAEAGPLEPRTLCDW